ncbi:hypothetical protein GOBAR_AA09750 [Gossypium barbadense]|uniref:Uncharacterized protein n=1 Tax=Gossypium barbadense TaxID=3634 RepID=A0A2P5Y5N3_GOSBA|nr:hypothetical protein GOBAR_AA09750 [Gossypium barbadense]
MKLLHVCAFPIISFFLFLFCSACDELIKALPGQSAKQYSGYILTQPQHGRALFYYFVEADSANPPAHPLTLRLDGGPGCSSLGFGAFMEDDPFQLGKHGRLIFMKKLSQTCYILRVQLELDFLLKHKVSLPCLNDTTTG